MAGFGGRKGREEIMELYDNLKNKKKLSKCYVKSYCKCFEISTNPSRSVNRNNFEIIISMATKM